MEEYQISEDNSKSSENKGVKTSPDSNGTENSNTEIPQYTYRAANDEFLESLDHGLCLSMHQPYASLLVAGIKR